MLSVDKQKLHGHFNEVTGFKNDDDDDDDDDDYWIAEF